jgi:hypothetical protein
LLLSRGALFKLIIKIVHHNHNPFFGECLGDFLGDFGGIDDAWEADLKNFRYFSGACLGLIN